MDKIREEFEKKFGIQTAVYYAESNAYQDDEFESIWNGYTEGYKSRDKEIHRLEQIATENSDWFDVLKIDFDKQKEEIRALSEKNEYLKAVLKIIAKYQYQTASKGALLLSGWAEQALETKK